MQFSDYYSESSSKVQRFTYRERCQVAQSLQRIDANLLVLFSLSYSENVRLNTREFLEEST